MTKYICKCGYTVKKNTSADVTGNRQTDDCQGCPYRMAYGNSTWAEDRHAFVTDVKGYECQMSQGITYYTELGGCLSDKTVLSVYSLDFDFLDVVCRWIRETYPGQELSAVFNREKVRKSEYSRCGRYRMAVYPASNKAGIAAKNEFARKFFDRESRRRLDLTPEQEKDKILADIAAGKAAAQKQEDTPMEIRQYKTDTGMIYAVRQQPEGGWRIMCCYPGAGWAMTTDPRLSTECGCAESLQEVLDAYAQRKGWAVYDPPEASPISPAVATAAAAAAASPPAEPALANTTAEPAAGGSEPEENALAEHPVTSELSQPAAFDFGADAETNAGLFQDAQIFMAGSMARVMAAKHAHDLTASNYRGSWGKWCQVVGISRDTGDNMVRVAEQFGNIQVEGRDLIDLQPLKLLYAASKPSTPPEVRQKVETLDITSYKQYQDLLAQLKAKSEELAAVKAEATLDRKEQEDANAAAQRYKAEADRRAQDQQRLEDRIKGLEDSYRSAHANEEFAIRRAADAESRAARAEQKAAELEARPIEVAVQQPSDADLTRWRAEGAEQARREAAASIASADAARQKAEDRIKKLQETLQGRTDHLNAVEAELAQLKAQLKTAPSSKPAPGCAPACIPCTECAYEDSCCGLSFLGDIPEEDDAINARLTGCTAGKRKGRPA